MSVGITNAPMISGECKSYLSVDFFMPPEAQKDEMPFCFRNIVKVEEEDGKEIQFWAKDSNAPWRIVGFVMTAQKVG